MRVSIRPDQIAKETHSVVKSYRSRSSGLSRELRPMLSSEAHLGPCCVNNSSGTEVGFSMMPLSEFPTAMREEIEYLVSLPDPPPKWKIFRDEDGRPMASIPSRAYYEWHLARGRDIKKRPHRERIPQYLRLAAIERDGFVCQLCGGDVDSYEQIDIDHKVPVARGGATTIDNLQVSHSSCNRRKGANPWPDPAS